MGYDARHAVSGAPISIGSWNPHNYDGSLGNGDLPQSRLGKSMNIPAVHLLQTVGTKPELQMVRSLRHKSSDGTLSTVRIGGD